MGENGSTGISASKRGILAATVMAALLAVTAFSILGHADTADAANEPPGISGIAVSFFDQDSEDYGELAYVSDLLPESVSAAEWVKDPVSGFWYNINTLSSDFGKILTCGKIPTLSNDEIRGDVVSKYPIFGGDFVIMQVTYNVAYDCNVSVKVTKEGMPDFTDSYEASLSVSGCRSETPLVHVKIYTVDTAAGDMKPAESRGTYGVSMKYNGIACDGVSITYKGADFILLGHVTDASGNGIPGADVSYRIDDVQCTAVSDATGTYAIPAGMGSVVTVDGIVSDKHTFNNGFPYSYGSVTGNVAPGPSFAADESSVQITVRDQSGRPADGATISAEWHHVSGGRIVRSPTGIAPSSESTGSDGKISVIYTSAPAGAMMYICGVNQTDSYSFDTNSIPDESASLPALTKEGNVYIDPSVTPAAELKVMEYSVLVTTRGNVDLSSEGGAILPNVSVTAEWYYQMDNLDGTYQVRTAGEVEPGTFSNLGDGGKAWAMTSHSDGAGKIVIVYKKPAWTVEGGETAFLYVYCNGIPSNSSSDRYLFEKPDRLSDGDSIPDQVSTFGGCKALELSSIGPLDEISVHSEQVAYLITGTITGDVPDEVTVFCLSATTGDFRTVPAVLGTIVFTFPVMEGQSSKIEIDSVAGYSFTNNGITLPSATGDQAYSSTATEFGVACERSAPAVVCTYTVTGLSEGDKAVFEYSVGGVRLSTPAMSPSDTITFSVHGRTGNVVSSIGITGVGGVYVPEFTGTSVEASKDAERKLVVYYSESSGPSIDNVRAGQKIDVYCNGAKSAGGISDSGGIITVTYPDVFDVVFKMGEFTLASAEIVSGIYNGFIGVNVYGAVPPEAAKTVDLTIRYVASSSMENQSAPTVVDILNPDPASPLVKTLAVGDTETFSAPDVDGFRFSGWYLDGICVSTKRDCKLTITEKMVGATLTASYGAVTPEPPPQDITTVLSVGLVSITIALLSLVYVILQVRRY
ncbi:MAG: hypothetical protein GX224_03575 [Thermoplasmatales archaeon]|nr:hypothetical protein [Thermoplasmatales archaeon]